MSIQGTPFESGPLLAVGRRSPAVVDVLFLRVLLGALVGRAAEHFVAVPP